MMWMLVWCGISQLICLGVRFVFVSVLIVIFLSMLIVSLNMVCLFMCRNVLLLIMLWLMLFGVYRMFEQLLFVCSVLLSMFGFFDVDRIIVLVLLLNSMQVVWFLKLRMCENVFVLIMSVVWCWLLWMKLLVVVIVYVKFEYMVCMLNVVLLFLMLSLFCSRYVVFGNMKLGVEVVMMIRLIDCGLILVVLIV